MVRYNNFFLLFKTNDVTAPIVTELMDGDISSLLSSKTDQTPLSKRLNWALEAAKGYLLFFLF